MRQRAVGLLEPHISLLPALRRFLTLGQVVDTFLFSRPGLDSPTSVRIKGAGVHFLHSYADWSRHHPDIQPSFRNVSKLNPLRQPFITEPTHTRSLAFKQSSFPWATKQHVQQILKIALPILE